MDTSFSDLLHKTYAEVQGEKPLGFSSPFGHAEGIPLRLLSGNVPGGGTIWVDKRIDNRSKVILDTFNDVLRKTFAPVMETSVRRIDYAKSFAERDYSLLVSSLARILEIELNLSVVQWVRGCEGIEMPQYYGRVKPGCALTVPPAINLNGVRDGKLEAQTLGSIQILLAAYKERFPEPLRDFAPELLAVWRKLRKERNNASHASVNGEEEFVEFYCHFCLIVEKGWLSALMDLKEQLRGG